MKLTESTINDIEQLTEWIQNDPYHKDCLDPHWWLTGNGLLAYCMQDMKGPTLYVRTDIDGEFLRLHTQFAPESVVSKTRVIKTILWTIPKMKHLACENNLKGLIFQSSSPSLIQFMQVKFRFVPTGNNDYVKIFDGEDA